MSNLNPQQFPYQTGHQPTYYAGLHEAEKAYPDVHEHPEYYTDSPESHDAFRTIRAKKDRPDSNTTIYRAIPSDVRPQRINPGDWVTTSRGYAAMHGRGNLPEGKGYRVVSKIVPAHHVGVTGDYLPEMGYFPNHGKPDWQE